MKVRGSESSRFGVKMLQPVTQYQQTTRAVKYGMLIIVLVLAVLHMGHLRKNSPSLLRRHTAG